MESTNTVVKSYHFPLEVLTQIFGYVDLRTLVFSCRYVCRFWRDTVECPTLWKIKIYRAHGHKFATDRALSEAHLVYPWYICYALCRNVFNTNMFTCNEEISGSPLFWRDADTPGFIWPMPFDACTLGFAPVPQELLDDVGNRSFLCIIGECSINHSIDLFAQGLTRKILGFQPPIRISEWFSSRFDYVAICHIEVKLFNSDWQCDTQHGYFRSQQRIGWQEWRQVSHTFTNYRPDVRYVVFHHGVDTCLPNFSGTFRHLDEGGAASKIAGTKLSVGIPDVSGPSDSSSSSDS